MECCTMTDDEADRLLRAVPETRVPALRLDDGVLLAYREGKLGEQEAANVERLLANDPEARALLRELSQPVSAEEVESLARLTPPTPRRKWAPLVLGGLGTAAAATLAILVARPVKAPLDYALEVEGLAAPSRGAGQGVVLPSTGRLVVRLRPAIATEAPRHFDVYLEGADGTLLAAPTGSRQAAQGAFEWVVEASDIAPFGATRAWVHVTDAPSSSLEGKPIIKVRTAGWFEVAFQLNDAGSP
jgi:hypothetical protein